MLNRFFYAATFLCIGGALLLGTFQAAQSRGLTAQSERFKNVERFNDFLELINKHYVDGAAIDYNELTDAAIDGMLQTLDPHSDRLSPRRLEDLRSDTRQEFGGVGIQIERRDGRITVISPISGTPAAKAGILPGDQVVEIEGEDMRDATIEEIVNLLRGRPGTDVEVTFHRPRTGEDLEVTLTRDTIRVESVRDTALLEDGIGYVRITRFGDRTGREFGAALDELEKQGMKGLIIDLRNNPGGLLSAAVDVADYFFERRELIVFTRGRDPEERNEIRGRTRPRNGKYPIAVLINAGSASASEIVAGALKDTHRAVLVGETTFGKGSVQTVHNLPRGEALRLTTARYYTPGEATIHEVGVSPHVEVLLKLEEERQLMIQRSRLDLMELDDFISQFGFEPIEDRQLDAARDALRAILLHREAANRSERDMARR